MPRLLTIVTSLLAALIVVVAAGAQTAESGTISGRVTLTAVGE